MTAGISPPSPTSGSTPCPEPSCSTATCWTGLARSLGHACDQSASNSRCSDADPRGADRREHAPHPQGLDLERRRTFLRGPYLWFHSITRALSSRSARLIVDYNAHAIPLGEMDRSTPEDRRRHEAWLRREAWNGDEGESVRASAGKSRAVDDSVHRAALPGRLQGT